MKLTRTLLSTCLAAALTVLAAAPADAYIVYLKDGSKIVAKEKYRIEGDKAILILPSGTEAFYNASEIDVAKTEEVNKVNYGTATLIEGSEATVLDKNATFEDSEVTLKELLARQRRQGSSRRQQEVAKPPETIPEDDLPRTKAGFVDLLTLQRDPYPKPEIVGEVMKYLKGQGIDNIRIYRGTVPEHPLLEIVAASEASVFKSLKDSANGLVQIHERFPQDVAAFELLLLTDSQVRAGQFTLTPELASLLVTEEVDPPSFFLRYVEF